MSKRLPQNWNLKIESRVDFILATLNINLPFGKSWIQKLEYISDNCESGKLLVWLSVTGCYPTKLDLFDFNNDIYVNGISVAVNNLIYKRISDQNCAFWLAAVELRNPKKSNIVDVTHTYNAPYLTGIQRVVYGLTDNVEDITTVSWIGDSGLLREVKLLNRTVTSQLNSHETWELKIVNFMYFLVPKLDRHIMGRLLIKSLRPLLKKIKNKLIIQSNISRAESMTSEGEHNLLVCNTKFTLPEIPSSNTQISIYEALLETKATYVQVVLYDFIPFFHAWTVHPQNRGHLNSYVRIVLLADRIVAISQLVEEQAKLITKAFRLERKQWISRKVEFDYLPLPSGLTSMTGPPISKIENLVVMLGSIEPRKNHLEFLYAIEILHNRGVPVIAELIGSAGWENDHILSKLENLQAKGISVRRLANLNDSQVKTRIAQARVLLQISEAEGFGLPVLEALTLGTKVIVSDIRPLNDIESPYITKIDLGRPDCVANAISEAISSSVQEKIVPPNSPSWETWHKLLYSD